MIITMILVMVIMTIMIIVIMILLMIKDDPRLWSWFPISVFDWDPDDPVDIRPAVTDNHDDDVDDVYDDGDDDVDDDDLKINRLLTWRAWNDCGAGKLSRNHSLPRFWESSWVSFGFLEKLVFFCPTEAQE